MRTGQGSMVVGLLLLGALAVASAQDVSVVLARYPQFSKFNELLKSTGLLADINTRSSVTMLLVDDGALNGYVGSHPSYTTQMVADVLRYHCLLQYFSVEDIKAQLVPLVVTTLYQTTGRANGLDGFVNVTAQPGAIGTVHPSTPGAPMQATIITNITQYPYNYSFMQISSVLEPVGLASAQLAPTSPPSMAPVPVPAPMMGPTMAPTMVPTMAPTMVPTMAPTPDAPMMPPTETPTETPTTPPVESPADVPTSETPVNPPTAEGPVAEGPMSSVNSASVVEFNVAAVVASVVVAAAAFVF